MEPRAGARRRARGAASRPRPSSASRSGSSASLVRVPGRRADRLSVRPATACTHLGVLDAGTGELIDLDLPYDALDRGPAHRRPRVARSCSSPASADRSPSRWSGSTSRRASVDVLRESAEVADRRARSCRCPSRSSSRPTGGLTAYALFYPPTNPDVAGSGRRAAAADRDQPRRADGRDDAAVRPGDPVLDQPRVRRRRRELRRHTGLRARLPAAAERQLGGRRPATASTRRGSWSSAARPTASGWSIRGGSAGGYTSLCALTFHDDFAAGASYYGIADLEPFATGDTHKFESEYEHTLVGPWPEDADAVPGAEPDPPRDGSARRRCSLLQGAEDEVVPPSQAEIMVEALSAKGCRTRTCFRGRAARVPQGRDDRRALRGRALVLRAGPRLRAGR